MLTTDCPRSQPHDLEAEQAILGAILLDATALDRVEHLTGSDFYDSRHRRIFEAMVDLVGRGEGLDLVTVGNVLDSTGSMNMIGGRSALADFLTTIASSSNIGHHARIVKDHAILRQLITLTAKISQRAYNKDSATSLLQDAQQDLQHLVSIRNVGSWRPLADVVQETVTYVDQVSKRGQTLLGITTGHRDLNTLLGGWQRSDLIIVGARPGMGKTSFAIGSVLAAAREGYRVGVISIEMSSRQVGLRLHGMAGALDVHALKTGTLTAQGWAQFGVTAHELESLPVHIDDSCIVTVEGIATRARQLQARNGLDLLVVDYLGLLQFEGADNVQQGLADASRQLKLLAKELNIPVIVLSQLNRACEARDDKRPRLADIRDSGAIEQDADVVMFIYRHEVYVPDTEEKGIAEILVRKHRNGPIGDRRLRFVERFARFEDLTL